MTPVFVSPRRLGAALALAIATAGLTAGCGPSAPPLDAAVLTSKFTPEMTAKLPDGKVERFVIEGFRDDGRRAETVVLAGHSVPPLYLDRPAEEVARAIVSFEPSLIVLDTCFGASTPLLEALAAAGSRAKVVAPAFLLPESGFRYAADFFARPDANSRAEAVRAEPDVRLLRWTITPEALKAPKAELEAMAPGALRRRLRHLAPYLVRVELPGAGWVLAPVAEARLK
jgi:hypothetical protein